MPAATLRAVADALVRYCRENKEATALSELYAPDAVSVEAAPMPGQTSREIRGLEGIRGKHAWWNEAMLVHGAVVDGPYFHGEDRFAVIFEIDATNKTTQQRMAMKEVALYTVQNGKIVREEFYYAP